ncbi:Flagellar basal-body rod modification protein FlgD [hydrothermal vent metagenome]|uniref:Flagellar basal-body rod modification protein FlgD n=1 Tax=hydrothermal vent metagenome TaxID=652676 RepID=A0A3B0TM45_9ZZZZ
MAINSLAATAAPSPLAGSRKSIANNFDTFLTLLTTQLKNQNPMDPLDTNQFTQQMVQFTSVEQQLKTNEYLKTLTLSTQNSVNSDAVAYIGKQITAQGSATQLVNSSAKWNYSSERAAAKTVFTVRDNKGSVVYTETKPTEAGKNEFAWDGRSSAGSQMPDGEYSITIDARDSKGAYVPVSTEMAGIVSSVDLSGVEPILVIGDAKVKLSSVTSVTAT